MMMTRNTDWTRKARFWAAPGLLLAAALWVGAPVAIDAVEDNMEREKIIVEFAAPAPDGEDAAPSEGQAEIAARILSRLGAQVRESARVFEFLPLIALESDAETMLRLIAMPEVLAIQPDRELEVLPSPALVDSPEASGDIAIPDISGEITIPQVPGEAADHDADVESSVPAE